MPLFRQQIIENNIGALKQISYDFTEKYYKVDAASSLIYELNADYYEKNHILEYLKKVDDGESVDEFEILKEFNDLCKQVTRIVDGIDSIILISKQGNVISNSRYSTINADYDFLAKDWFNELKESKSRKLKILSPEVPADYYLGVRRGIITFARNIYSLEEPYNDEILGILLIIVNNIFFEKMSNIFDINWVKDIIILAPDGYIAYNKNTDLIGKKLPYADGLDLNSEEKGGNFDYNESDNEYSICYYQSDNTGYSFLSVITYDYIENKLNILEKNLLISASILLITGLVITYFSVRNRYKPIKGILSTLRQFENGNLEARMQEIKESEMGIIIEGFNTMAEKLQKYIAEVYGTRLKKKDAELCALKSQIDSHFLSNMLETARARSLENDDHDTAELLALLGMYYREKLTLDDDLIELKSELTLTDSYIRIEGYKGIKKINLTIDVEERFMSLFIPKFTLQPLVENSIRHGCKNRDEVEIIIRSKMDDDKLVICISDNGSGIDAKTLSELKASLKDDLDLFSNMNIGIKNVNNRLKLYFGNDYGVDIESIPETGTTAYVTIPSIGGIH